MSYETKSLISIEKPDDASAEERVEDLVALMKDHLDGEEEYEVFVATERTLDGEQVGRSERMLKR